MQFLINEKTCLSQLVHNHALYRLYHTTSKLQSKLDICRCHKTNLFIALREYSFLSTRNYLFVCRCFCVSYVLTNWLQRDNVGSSCCNRLSQYLKELKAATQCSGIEPKAINDSYIKDTERNGI